MFLALWEFEVKPGCENRFETTYGPNGDWAQLFRTDPDYQGTRLLRDLSRENLYVTADAWLSVASYEHFMQSHHHKYKALDDACECLTLAERRLGFFEGINT